MLLIGILVIAIAVLVVVLRGSGNGYANDSSGNRDINSRGMFF